MEIKAAIFDFGNVLIGWSPERLYRLLIPDEDERRYFLDHVCDARWNLENDLGRPWAEGLAAKIALFPRYATEIMAYRERFLEMLSDPIEEGVTLLHQFHGAGIPCYGLTNWSADTFEETLPLLPFMHLFTHVAVSGRLKIGKPDPAAFHHILEIIEKPPHECVFIDDSAANIEAAAHLGFQVVHFLGDGSAQARLESLGWCRKP